MQPHTLTSNQRMADAILRGQGTDLRSYLSELFAAGYSIEGIARQLHDITDGSVSLTFTTVRRWLDQLGIRSVAS